MKLRTATKHDAELLFEWANDPTVRENSFHSNVIVWEEHISWFKTKLADEHSYIYIFEENKKPIGSVRVEHKNKETIISIVIDKESRGKGYGATMLENACSEYWKQNDHNVFAYIKHNNTASVKTFEKAGFTHHRSILFKNVKSEIFVAKK